MHHALAEQWWRSWRDVFVQDFQDSTVELEHSPEAYLYLQHALFTGTGVALKDFLHSPRFEQSRFIKLLDPTCPRLQTLKDLMQRWCKRYGSYTIDIAQNGYKVSSQITDRYAEIVDMHSQDTLSHTDLAIASDLLALAKTNMLGRNLLEGSAHHRLILAQYPAFYEVYPLMFGDETELLKLQAFERGVGLIAHDPNFGYKAQCLFFAPYDP